MRFLMSLILIGMLNLQACSIVDDYLLGKDNTLTPAKLKKIHTKIQCQQQWSTSIGKANKTRAYLKLKPVRVGHTIYAAEANGQISAVDAQSGRIIWSTTLKQPLISGPTIASGYVILGTDAATLVALSQTDGHQLWEARLSEDALSKSAVHGDTVITKTIDGHLYALDLKSGKQRWMVEHGSPNLILRASSSPKIMGELVLVGYSDGKLDAVDIQSGRVVWQRSIAYANGASDIERLVDIDADPVIRNQLIYLASYQGYVGALNLQDGQFIWSKPASVYKNIALDNNTLYVSDSHDVLWAYQLSTGQVKWKQAALKGHDVTEPVLIGKHLVVGDKTGYLHVIDITNGELIGRHALNSAVDISPAQSGDQVVVMTANGLLQSYKLQAVS